MHKYDIEDFKNRICTPILVHSIPSSIEVG